MAESKGFSDFAVGFIGPIVKAFLASGAAKDGNWTATRLGREATGAPSKIFQIQAGAQPRRETAHKILKVIEKVAPGLIKEFLESKARGLS